MQNSYCDIRNVDCVNQDLELYNQVYSDRVSRYSVLEFASSYIYILTLNIVLKLWKSFLARNICNIPVDGGRKMADLF
jgi:hypothetical protein